MDLIINNKKYNVVVVETDEDKAKGLQEIAEMEGDEGMLFIFDEPQEVSFWMKETDIPLDIVFIDQNWVIKSVRQGVPNSEEALIEDGIQYVLEVNENSGIEPGMEVDFDEPEDFYQGYEVNKMYIVSEDGLPQAEMIGGERIFSRENTKTLVKLAKRAYLSEKENDYKKLGKKAFEFLKIQDSNKAEYVTK